MKRFAMLIAAAASLMAAMPASAQLSERGIARAPVTSAVGATDPMDSQARMRRRMNRGPMMRRGPVMHRGGMMHRGPMHRGRMMRRMR